MTRQMRGGEGLASPGRGWAATAMAQRRWRMRRQEEPPLGKEAFVDALIHSIAAAQRSDMPYRHWTLRNCLPKEAVTEIEALPFPAPALDGPSGRRELHNATRKYFDPEARIANPVCESFCQAFQDDRITTMIAAHFGTRLAGTFLRVEYAQDTDGFWLEPHTDLGVKVFTMLLYMSSHPQHATLGTDLYDLDKTHAGRSAFEPNLALVFVPSDVTYHGFEPRRIEGVRKSVIVNYVTSDWRAREQLAFPDRPV
jgi:hypothetical protein